MRVYGWVRRVGWGRTLPKRAGIGLILDSLGSGSEYYGMVRMVDHSLWLS